MMIEIDLGDGDGAIMMEDNIDITSLSRVLIDTFRAHMEKHNIPLSVDDANLVELALLCMLACQNELYQPGANLAYTHAIGISVTGDKIAIEEMLIRELKVENDI